MANITWIIPGYDPQKEIIDKWVNSEPLGNLSQEADYFGRRLMATMGIDGFRQMIDGAPLRPSRMYLTQEMYNDIVSMSEEERASWVRGHDEVYVYAEGEPQYVGRIPTRQDMPAIGSNPAGPAGEFTFFDVSLVSEPVPGTGVISVSRNVDSFNEPTPEAPLQIDRGEPSINDREAPMSASPSFRKDAPSWSREYKKQNQHLFRKKR